MLITFDISPIEFVININTQLILQQHFIEGHG